MKMNIVIRLIEMSVLYPYAYIKFVHWEIIEDSQKKLLIVLVPKQNSLIHNNCHNCQAPSFLDLHIKIEICLMVISLGEILRKWTMITIFKNNVLCIWVYETLFSGKIPSADKKVLWLYWWRQNILQTFYKAHSILNLYSCKSKW